MMAGVAAINWTFIIYIIMPDDGHKNTTVMLVYTVIQSYHIQIVLKLFTNQNFKTFFKL